MCNFQAEQQYFVSTHTNCTKTLLFVKLTDSALYSFERYLQTKGNSLTKPTIQFNSNNGTITLPLNGQDITYRFTLSSVEADGNSFQCLQHTGQRSLKSLGSIHMKMQIHANEDSYANTKCKMAAVDQEQKSLCTKEIKPNGSRLNHKVKFKHPGSIFPAKTIPVSKAQKTTFRKPNDKTKDHALLQEPIRKRIIHILAIKPYKKPDILLRLIKEGINDDDRRDVHDLLDQVGSRKGDMYSLSSLLWDEVEDNWKFCSKDELELICRRKQQYLKVNESPISVPQNSVKKHVENKPAFKEPQSKKQRLSHYNNHKVPDQIVKAGSSDCNDSSKIKPITVENSWKIPLSDQVNDHSNGVAETNGKSSRNGLSAHLKLHKNNITMECNGSSPTSQHATDSVPEFDSSDHMQKYQKITSEEQRAQYQIDFDSQYSEYIQLHKEMQDINNKLQSLVNHLANCEEGSNEFKKTKYKLCKLYKTAEENDGYKKVRYNKLKATLSHIKNLALEYDNAESIK